MATGLDLTISTEGIVKIFRQRYPYPYSCPYPTMPPPMCYAPQPAMMLPPTENNTKTKELEETTQNMKEQHRKDLDKIKAQLSLLELNQGEKFKKLENEIDNTLPKLEELTYLSKRVNILAKKLPPSSENIIESIKKSITTLIDETSKVEANETSDQKSLNPDNQSLNPQAIAMGEIGNVVQDMPLPDSKPETPGPDNKWENMAKQTGKSKGLWPFGR